jgi:beta-phosphoglucomutase family hydrolase
MRAVIFDMDGVLVETDHLFSQFVRDFVKSLGADPPRDVDRYRGMTSNDQWKVFKEKSNLNKSVRELVSEAREKYLVYLESMPDIEATEGVTRLIRELNTANVKIAVASSANPLRISMLLKKIGLDWAFPVIVSADDIKKGKPAPDCFLLAASKLNVRPEECVVIEDAERGISAARAAGMKCVGYKGCSQNLDDLDGADLVVRSFHEVTLSKLKSLSRKDL